MKKFTGAGIRFTVRKDDGMRRTLLARRRSGIWSIPGGGRSRHDGEPWDTAKRETIEEFVPPPDWGKEILVQRYPIGLIGFDWTTFVRELPEILLPPALQDPNHILRHQTGSPRIKKTVNAACFSCPKSISLMLLLL